MRNHNVFFLVWLIWLALPALGDTGVLSAGAARVEITPSANILNWVTRKPYDGVLDPVFVRALVLSDSSNRVAILCWDLVDTREGIVGKIRSAIQTATAIPATNILINASHTHSSLFAPVVGDLLIAGDRKLLAPVAQGPGYSEWAERLPERCVQAVRAAESARRPATLAIGRAWVGEVVFNRRPVREDGTVETTMVPSNPFSLPKGERFAPTDPILTLLSVRDERDQTIATLFTLPCHSVSIYNSHKGLSPDWPGAVCARLQQALGGEALFLQGCAGDIVPARRGVAACEAMARLVADRALMAVTNRQVLQSARLQVARLPVALPLTPAARDDVGAPTLASEVQVIACGPLALAALPGEPLIGLAMEIQRRSPFPHTLVLGYSNGDGVEYVGLPGGKAQGGYEMGPYGAGADECGQLLIDAAGKLLDSLDRSFAAPTPTAATARKGAKRASAKSPQADDARGMKLLSKEVFLRHHGRRPPCITFVSYVSTNQPLLMRCVAWDDYSDAVDDFSVSLSSDNGKTWSPDELRWKSEVVPEGRIRYGETAAFFDRDTQKLIVLIDRTLYPGDKLNLEAEYELELNVYDPLLRQWSERRMLNFPGQRTPAMSFSFPIKTSHGHLLFPGMRKSVDASGKAVHFQKTRTTVDEVVTVNGEYGADGKLSWRLGKPLTLAGEISSRGLDENTLAELPDGRVAAVCRADNSAFPDKPCYKWLSFSHDEGETWSAPVPLPATGGGPIESGANGSVLFRSIKNGKLYWIGNLALDGERANGNWPRSPLVILEVQEEPFALKRDTMLTIDRRSGTDSRRVQFSNFRFYQDRETGDVVLFLTRYGEQSEKEWYLADCYRYRVRMP